MLNCLVVGKVLLTIICLSGSIQSPVKTETNQGKVSIQKTKVQTHLNYKKQAGIADTIGNGNISIKAKEEIKTDQNYKHQAGKDKYTVKSKTVSVPHRGFKQKKK